MTTAGRTIWYARDVAWHRRELVVNLGQEHGPAALAVLDVLSAWAKEQRDGGRVKGGFTSLARESFTDAAAARRVVEDAAGLGVLDEYEPDQDGRRFTLRVSGWRSDQERARAASRQQAARDRQSDGAGPSGPEQDVTHRDQGAGSATNRDKPLLDVTDTRVKGQDRTGQDRTEPSSLRSDGSAARARSDNRRKAGEEDAWPDRLPSSLHQVAELVHRRLSELAEFKGGQVPSRRRVGEVVADFPEHDHAAVVGDVVDYWQFGRGARTVRKDWCRVYRDRCKHVPAPASVSVVGGGLSELERFRAHQRRIRQEEVA